MRPAQRLLCPGNQYRNVISVAGTVLSAFLAFRLASMRPLAKCKERSAGRLALCCAVCRPASHPNAIQRCCMGREERRGRERECTPQSCVNPPGQAISARNLCARAHTAKSLKDAPSSADRHCTAVSSELKGAERQSSHRSNKTA